jgi:hypothetical protein
MIQHNLFEESVPNTFPNAEPIARTVDPSTSHEAAAEHTGSGKRDSHKSQLLGWMADHPGPTGTKREVSRDSGIAHEIVCKRMPDLARDGFVRKCGVKVCSVTGHNAAIWEVIPVAERKLKATAEEAEEEE